jgi:hypothetical protein
MLNDLAEIQAQIAELRQMAVTAVGDEATSLNWMADELETRARELDAMA